MADAPAPHPPIAAPLGDVTTKRLHLRRFRADDLDHLALVFAKPEVWRYPYDQAFDRSETRTFLDAQMRERDECGFG